MVNRQVTATRKNSAGYVTHFACADNPASAIPADEVLLDIELGSNSYYVSWPDRRVTVRHATDEGGGYLRCDKDTSPHNDLLDLPDC